MFWKEMKRIRKGSYSSEKQVEREGDEKLVR